MPKKATDPKEEPKQDETPAETTEEEAPAEETPAESTEEEEVEEEVELDPADRDKIVGQVVDKVADAVFEKIAATDQPKETKKLGAVKVTEGFEKMGKEQRFGKGVIALLRDDKQTLSKLNQFASQKAGYQNETTDADGGYLVPDADFEADVLRLEEEYGAARQAGVRVRRVNSDSLKLNKKASGVTMYATNEAAQKTGTKMTFDQEEVTLVKYAAIAAVTDELEEDAAVDIYQELTRDFAREKARVEDDRVFTHATSGLIHQAGLNIISVHASDFAGNVDFDDLFDAIYGVPTPSATRGKFVMNPYAWNVIRKLKVASEANHYALSPVSAPADPNLSLLGRPVVLAEVLASANAADTAYIIYGDFSHVTLIEKRGLVLDIGREGTVHDSDGNAVNLFEKDLKALRAVTRLNALTVFPDAFTVIGTGGVS